MESATPKYRELWTVSLSNRKDFQLSGEEMAQVRQRMQAGDSGLVEVKDGGFKISHIVSWSLDSRQIENQLAAPDKYRGISEEERAKGQKKLKAIRDKFRF